MVWEAVRRGYLGGEGLEAVESNSGTLGGKHVEYGRGERVKRGGEEEREKREGKKKKGKRNQRREKKNNMR